MKKRFLYLLRIYLLTVTLFIVAKVVFMFLNGEGHDFSMTDVLTVVAHGMSLDLSTALYFLIIPFLLTIVSVWLRIPQWLYRFYYGVVALAFALAFVADTSLYAFWNFKLDASCLGYLETPTEAMASVTPWYLLLRLLAIVVISAGIFWIYNIRTGFAPVTGNKFVKTLMFLPFFPVIIIGVRGGLSESTTNIGQVYYSDNQFLNHSAVNPVFSFLSSLGKSGDYIVSYDYYPDDVCKAMTDSLFSTVSEHPDTLLTTKRPDILIILMESCGGQFTLLGGQPDMTPNLSKMAKEGVFFKACYANSWRTDKGMVSVLSGYPAFPITSVMKVPEKSRKLPSIASSLKEQGYTSAFFYGGDVNFTNMRSYIMGTGFDRISGKNDYSREEQQSAQWGVRDDLMFASLLEDIRREKSSHWMKAMLTLSSHEPWDVPDKPQPTAWNKEGDEVYNAFHYMDRCLGAFVDSLRQTPVWDNLLVIMLPDHGYRYKNINETTRLYNHIPMIWVGGAVRKPVEISGICNQSDLAATLLGQMDIDHSSYTFSRDVASRSRGAEIAWHTYNNGVSLFDSTGFMAYDLDADQMIASEGPHAEQQLNLARALLQLTSHDLKQK